MLRILIAFLVLAAPAQAQGLPPPDAAPWIREGEVRALGPARSYVGPGHVIVLTPRVRPGDAAALGAALAARHGADLAAIHPLATLDETCFVLRFGDGTDTEAASAAVMAEDGVLLAYPIQAFEVGPQSSAGPGPDALPFADEPLIEVQDALRTMRVREVQARVTGRGVRVAMVDTGAAADHPDLAEQAVAVHDFVGGGGAAERHGTAVAALIAADARNRVGMVGVAPDVELLALRGCWEDEGGGRCSTFSLALALDHAVMAGADVVNLSLEGPSDRLLEALVAAAIEGGALVVAAAGAAPFPASVPGVLVADAAEGPPSGRAALRAPARDVLGAEPSGGYDFFSGSSVAAAHASGVAALLRSAVPGAGADEVAGALGARGDPLDACGALGVLTATDPCD